MPMQQLTEFQNRLAGLKSCFALTKDELQSSPVCPHCEFRPSLELIGSPSSKILAQLDDELDTLISTWTETLLANLNDPTTRENLSLLAPSSQRQVEAFIKKRELPDALQQDFLQDLREALSGLVKVVVKTEAIADCTPRRRFPGDSSRNEEAVRALPRRSDQGQGTEQGPARAGVRFDGPRGAD